MPETANIDLCRELFELSGWDDTTFYYADGVVHVKNMPQINIDEVYKDLGTPSGAWKTEGFNDEYSERVESYTNAYDLGFLLRKLPDGIELKHGGMTRGTWRVLFYGGTQQEFSLADTPEDAACKLCIVLLKEGVLHAGN